MAMQPQSGLDLALPLSEPAGRRRGAVSLVIRLVVLALALALIGWMVDLGEVARALGSVPAGVVASGFGLGLARVFLLSLRWRVLDDAGIAEREATTGRTIVRLSQWQYFRYRLANATFNLFLPTALGADAARAALVTSEVENDRTRRVVVILFDRMLGIGSIGLLGLVAGLAAPGLVHAGSYLGAIVSLDIVVLGAFSIGFSSSLRRRADAVFRRMGRVGRRLSDFVITVGECFDTFRRHKGRVLVALVLCTGVHTTSFCLVYVAAVALGLDLSFATVAVVTTISWVIVLVPVTVGGLGLRELAFVLLLAPQGVDESAALALSLFQFAVIVMVGVVGIPVTVFGRAPRACAR